MQPELHQMALNDEEREAFERAYQMHLMNPQQRNAILLACAPGFIIGYRCARNAMKPDIERTEASAKLAEDLDYPQAWDTAAYPNVESAAIEALHTASVEAADFAKRLQNSNKDAYYTMNQMRDYADGVVTTRNYTVVDALETKIRECLENVERFRADCNHGVSSAYNLMASELRTIADNAKRMGRQPFQKRAMFWAKKCFGMTLAMGIKERNQRFIEEGLELVQAGGMTKREAIGAVNYVYGRPVGDMRQEVGGVYNTLAVLCEAHGIDMVGEGERDLIEINNEESTTRIRMKRRTKPDFGGDDIEPLTKQKFVDSLDADTRPTLTYPNKMLNASGELVYELVKKALHS